METNWLVSRQIKIKMLSRYFLNLINSIHRIKSGLNMKTVLLKRMTLKSIMDLTNFLKAEEKAEYHHSKLMTATLKDRIYMT